VYKRGVLIDVRTWPPKMNLYYAQESKKAEKQLLNYYITTTIKANFSMQKTNHE